MLCGVGYYEKISSAKQWQCFMCEDKNVRLLKVRQNWQERIKEIFNQDAHHIDFVSLRTNKKNKTIKSKQINE